MLNSLNTFCVSRAIYSFHFASFREEILKIHYFVGKHSF